MKILVLSPHRGDAAFALALCLSAWLKAGHVITILNCFSRSLEAPFSDAAFTHPNDRLSYVSAMRKKEDEAFLRQLFPAKTNKLSMIDLNLKDAPVRLHCTEADVSERAVNPDDPALEKIRKALGRLREEGGVDALVLPLALGNHVDHRTVRDAGLPGSPSLPCAFYEDLPDSTHAGVTVDLRAFHVDPATQGYEELSPVLCVVPNAAATKRRLISRYVSQLDETLLQAITIFASRYDGERLWANQAWLDVHLLTPVHHPAP